MSGLFEGAIDRVKRNACLVLAAMMVVLTVLAGPASALTVGGTPAATGAFVTAQSAEDNALLASLSLSAGALLEDFDPANTYYNAIVSYATATIKVTPTTQEAGARVAMTMTTLSNNVTVNVDPSSPSINLERGYNLFHIRVTSQNGRTVREYMLYVNRSPASHNADLSGLSLSAGTLSPRFSPEIIGYTASVDSQTASITVTPTTADPTATVTVNGNPVTSGSASADIPLVDRRTVISTVVTAENGTRQTYVTFVGRGDPPTLTSVSPPRGAEWGGGEVWLTGRGLLDASSVKFGDVYSQAFVSFSDESMLVYVPPGAPGTVDVRVGSLTGVSAISADAKYTYLSANSRLSALVPSSGALSPSFNSDAGEFTLAVPFSTSSITFTPTSEHPGATIYLGSTAVASGSPTAPIQLGVGQNAIDFYVTSELGNATQGYVVYVTRAPLEPVVASISSNKGAASGGTQVVITGTGFSGATAVTFGQTNAITYSVVSETQITATAPAGTGTVDIHVTTPEGTSASSAGGQFTFMDLATVTSISRSRGPNGSPTSIYGVGFTGVTAVLFGETSATEFTFNSDGDVLATAPPGTGTVDVRVVTPGGTSAPTADARFTYLSTDPRLSALVPSSGALSPGFSGDTLQYALTVPFSATSITFTPTAETAGATIYLGDDVVASGSPTRAIQLEQGSNTITFLVIAEAGGYDVHYYTVTVTRAAAPPTVTAISSNSGPAAGGAQVVITGTDFSDVTSVLFGTAEAATFAVDSATQITATAPAGVGIVDIHVVTPRGANAATEAGQFTYLAAATVTSLSPSSGPDTGSQVHIFGTGFEGATAVMFGETPAPQFTVENDGGILALSPPGAGTVDVRVVTSGGTNAPAAGGRFTYLSTNRRLSALVSSSGTLSPSFSRDGLAYAVTVPFSATSITFTPTAENAGATITLDDDVVASGSPTRAIELALGTNLVTFRVQSEAGDDHGVNAYTVTVTRAPAPPTVTSISSNRGPASGGAQVVITGTGFSNATSVLFGTTEAATFVVNGATQITATAPAGTGVVDIHVTTPGGSNAATEAGQFTYLDAPEVEYLSVDRWLDWGGLLTIRGTGFTDATAVMFGDTVVTEFDSYFDIYIQVHPPLGLIGTFDVRVVGPGGISAVSPNAQITYVSTNGRLSSLTPSSGSLSPSFDGDRDGNGGWFTMTVPFSTTSIAFTPTAENPVTIIHLNDEVVASGSTTRPIELAVGETVITMRTQAEAGLGYGDRYYVVTVTRAPAPPTVTSVSPDNGLASGGAQVVITGTDLSDATAVTFGQTDAVSYSVVSETQITATAPAGTGTVDIRVTTPGGVSTTSAAGQFSYVSTPTVTWISPQSAPASGGETLAIHGTGFVNVTSIMFGTTNAAGFAVNSSTLITATVPAGTGTVDVVVTTAAGTSATSEATRLTYMEAAPIAGAVTETVAFGSSANSIAVNLSGGPTTSLLVVTGAAHGTATVSDLGITYTPESGYFGPDSFAYTATGPGGTSDPATVTVTVTPPAAPVVTPVSVGTAFETSTSIDLAGSITGLHTGITVTSAPTHGTTSVAGDVVTYTPATGYAGVDSFAYTATGPGGTSDPATVTVTVTASPPVVASVSVAAAFDGPTAIDLGGSITGVHTGITVTSAPTHGTTSVAGDVVTYRPATGYFGADSFTYVATGPGGTSAAATVTLTVAPPAAPIVAPVSVAAAFDAPTSIDLGGSITGVHTGIALTSAPIHGTASVAGDVVTYRPEAGYFGADSFTYAATGPGGTSAAATVTLTVATPPAPVIEQPTEPVVVPPSSGGGSASVSVDLPTFALGLVDGFRITSSSQYGMATIFSGSVPDPAPFARSASPRAGGGYQLVYTPAANFMGTDTVTLVACGPGGESAPVTYTFQVLGKAPDLSGQTNTGASATFTPTTGLVGGPFQAVRITRSPDFGTANVNGLSIVFTPGATGGKTSLDYVIDLPFGASASGRIDLTSNALPGSEALVVRTLQGVPVKVRIGETAGGPFTAATVVSMAPATAGEATIAKVGNAYDLTFVSTGNFSGEALVTYRLTNAFGTTNSTLAVTVEARPNPSLDPEVRGVATGQVTSARRFADAQINNFQQRLRDLHDGANGSSNGLNLNLGFGGADADRDPREVLRRQLGQERGLDLLGHERDRELLARDVWAGRVSTASTVGATDARLNAAPQSGAAEAGGALGLWTSGSINWGRQDATGQRDSRFTTQGATLGLDVKVSDQLIVGAGVGYGEDKTRVGDKGSVTNGKAVTGAFYASWRPAQAFYVDGVVGFADLDFTSHRWVQGLAGQVDGYAAGERSGEVRFASAAFGRVLRTERVTSDFYARLDARDITLDGFTETGGGFASLSWDEIGQKSLSANLGASWRWTLDSRRHGQFRPSARVEWSHELEDIGAQGVRYADWASSPTYLVPLNAWSRNAINLDLGTEWSLNERLMFSLGYRSMLGDASTSHGAQIGLKYGW